MGVESRQWREPPAIPREGGAGGLANLSVTAWIIIACVAVFVVDGFLPPRMVRLAVSIDPGVDIDEVRGKQVIFTEPVSQTRVERLPNGRLTERTVPAMGGDAPIVLAETKKQVGTISYQLMPLLNSWLYFSTAKALVVEQPFIGWTGLEFWRIVGFQFVHADGNHLIFNMLGLFFFGGVIERYLGAKRYLAFYLLCGIFGALMYLALNLGGWTLTLLGIKAIPGLLFNDPTTPLVGASAGIFGIMFAAARLAPNTQVLLFFVIPMKLRTLAILLLGWAIWTIVRAGNNAGGEAAHLGGAIAGWYFIGNTHHLHGFFDFLGRVDPTSRAGAARRARRQAPDNAEIDRILAKIQAQGIGSLTRQERATLSRASRDD
jgi:membrane associated rhomboid family serine protease